MRLIAIIAAFAVILCGGYVLFAEAFPYLKGLLRFTSAAYVATTALALALTVIVIRAVRTL